MATPTLKDVADYAHVSRATVSRVLNNNPNVAPDLRERVLEAVEQLGYHPNRAARRLRANISAVFGLIISDIENPFFISVVRGVEDIAYAHQLSVVLCNTDEDPDKQRMYLQVMLAERVAGLVISPTSVNDAQDFEQLRQSNIPIILLDRRVHNFEADSVTIDNVTGAYTAVKHLIDLGHKRIGMIGGSADLTTGSERYEGYRKALNTAGIKVDDRLIKMGDFKTDSGYRLALEFIHSAHPPSALFVANNLMTQGTLRALREHGVRIPDDLALVGFDDMPWSGDLCPPLTAVSQPTYELGQETVHLLLRRMSDPNAPVRMVTLQPRLIVRESCGAALQQRSN